MALTEITYTGDGSDVTFGPIPFPYLEDSDVLITINGVATTAFTIDPSTKIITFSSAPADGTVIRVYRNTNNDTLAATFISGSAIRAQDLNENFTQNLYVVQEVNNNALTIDGSNPMVGDLNMGNYRVVNAGQPTANNDLATKQYVDSYAIADPTTPSITYWNKAATEGQLTLSGADDFGIILSYVPNREQVYVNGALQQRDIDYTPTLEDQITFTVPLKGGDVVNVIALNYLTGRDGSQGLQGLQGIQGIQGEVGPQGIQGVEGPIGLTGYVDALQDGTAALPGIRFENDTNTGIYRPGADQVAVATNGTGRLFVDASGNVGVGTSSVNALLEVNNSTAGGEVQRIEGNYDGSGSVTLTNWRRAGGSVAAALKYNDDSSPLCMSIGTTTSHEFRIRTADTDAITIDASQRVGIGTSAPGYPFDVQSASLGVVARFQSTAANTYGTIRLTGNDRGGQLDFYNGATAQAAIWGNSSTLNFGVGPSSTQAMIIDSSGNVGIGTTSPGELLSVYGNVSILSSNRIKTTDSGGNLTIQGGGTFPGGHIILNGGNGSDNIIFNRSGASASTVETARIDSSGRLLVGTSSARANFFNTVVSPQFQIEGAGDFDRQAAIISSSSIAAYGAVQILAHQKSGTIGGNTILASGDALGLTSFQGSDGTRVCRRCSY
jgi:hypothetical protein